jgi:hypothetical protein
MLKSAIVADHCCSKRNMQVHEPSHRRVFPLRFRLSHNFGKTCWIQLRRDSKKSAHSITMPRRRHVPVRFVEQIDPVVPVGPSGRH